MGSVNKIVSGISYKEADVREMAQANLERQYRRCKDSNDFLVGF